MSQMSFHRIFQLYLNNTDAVRIMGYRESDPARLMRSITVPLLPSL